MKSTALKKSRPAKTETVLLSIFKKAEAEFREVEQMFSLLGWDSLPNQLKLVIEEDVKGYIDELNGCYSTNSIFVQRRRESVDFWVNSYMDGICTLDTALQALKVEIL